MHRSTVDLLRPGVDETSDTVEEPAGAHGRIHERAQCPRHESNMRTRFRKPLLYPLSYGGSRRFAGISASRVARFYSARLTCLGARYQISMRVTGTPAIWPGTRSSSSASSHVASSPSRIATMIRSGRCSAIASRTAWLGTSGLTSTAGAAGGASAAMDSPTACASFPCSAFVVREPGEARLLDGGHDDEQLVVGLEVSRQDASVDG